MEEYNTSSWVAQVRDEIGRSPAWEVLSDQLYERVAIVLESHGLGHFSDLSEAEQITLLEEAHRELICEESKVYQAFEAQFSKSMDAGIAKEARSRHDELAKHEGSDEALYLERVLETAAEGAISLLRELPREHLGSLRLMLNQPIPSRARLDIWRLLLKHTAMREEYELLMKQNRNSTISGQDIYITHRCQALLESGRVADRRLLPLTSRNVILMKTVLSYYHACKMAKPGEKTTVQVPEGFIHFMVPLCAAVTRGNKFSSASRTVKAGGSGPATAVGIGGTASSGTPAASKEQKMEFTIAELVELFQAALEAGLKEFVDPNELRSADRVEDKSAGRARGGGGLLRGVARTTESSAEEGLGVSRGEAEEGIPPAWVDVAYSALVPGFQMLVNHVTLVHRGVDPLALRTEEDGDAVDGTMEDDDTTADAKCEDTEEKHEDGAHVDDDDLFSLADDDTSVEGAVEGQPATHQENTADDKIASRTNQEQDAGGRRSSARRRSRTQTNHGDPNKSVNETTLTNIQSEHSQPGEQNPTAAQNTNLREPGLSASLSPAQKASAIFPATPTQERAALWALLRPILAVGLVGYLGAEACLFAWDQAVIGGFETMFPRVAAMILAAAREKVEACGTFPRMCDALLSHAHLVSISQLQHFLEEHCMPSIREEMRVSEKLTPEIVGPTLEAATQILDKAYSKRTRLVQEARMAHIEHVLSDPKAPPAGSNNGRVRLHLATTATSATNNARNGINSSEDPRKLEYRDRVVGTHGGQMLGNRDSRNSVETENGGYPGDKDGGYQDNKRELRKRGAVDEDRKQKNGARRSGTFDGETDDDDKGKGRRRGRSRAPEEGMDSTVDGKRQQRKSAEVLSRYQDDSDDRVQSRDLPDREKSERMKVSERRGDGGGKERRTDSDVPRIGKRSKAEDRSSGNEGSSVSSRKGLGRSRGSRDTSAANSTYNKGGRKEKQQQVSSDRDTEGKAVDSRDRFAHGDISRNSDESDDSRERVGRDRAEPRGGNRAAVVEGGQGKEAFDGGARDRARRRLSGGVRNEDHDYALNKKGDAARSSATTSSAGDYTNDHHRKDSRNRGQYSIDRTLSRSGQTGSFGQENNTARHDYDDIQEASHSGDGWWWERDNEAREAEKTRLAEIIRREMEKAQLSVYRRTYSEAEIEALTGSELATYTKKKAKFEKALATLRSEREKKERKAAEATAKLEKKKRDKKKKSTPHSGNDRDKGEHRDRREEAFSEKSDRTKSTSGKKNRQENRDSKKNGKGRSTGAPKKGQQATDDDGNGGMEDNKNGMRSTNKSVRQRQQGEQDYSSSGNGTRTRRTSWPASKVAVDDEKQAAETRSKTVTSTVSSRDDQQANNTKRGRDADGDGGLVDSANNEDGQDNNGDGAKSKRSVSPLKRLFGLGGGKKQ